MHSFLPSILNQLQQIGQYKAEPWPHYPPTLIWNECEIIVLFGPALLWSRPVWCFIYCHLHAQNSVNPLFVFKHLEPAALRQSVSMLAAMSSLSIWVPVELIWQAACCWGQCLISEKCDGGSVLSACLSEYLSVCLFTCVSASLSLHSSAGPDGLWVTKDNLLFLLCHAFIYLTYSWPKICWITITLMFERF